MHASVLSCYSFLLRLSMQVGQHPQSLSAVHGGLLCAAADGGAAHNTGQGLPSRCVLTPAEDSQCCAVL